MELVSSNAIIKISVYILRKILPFYPAIINSLMRPKLNFELNPQLISIKGDDGIERHYRYFGILITNPTDKHYHLNTKNIRLNDNILQTANKYLNFHSNQQGLWTECDTDKCHSCQEISKNNSIFKLSPYDPKIIALKPVSSGYHIITSLKKSSLLFFGYKKISLTLEINGKEYEYGVCRNTVYERLIPYLAFYHETRF